MNIQLAEKVLNFLTVYPEKHKNDIRNGSFKKGSTAFWVVMLSDIHKNPNAKYLFESRSHFYLAMDLLGIDLSEACIIFNPQNNKQSLHELALLIVRYKSFLKNN
jgi:hypothetical protein